MKKIILAQFIILAFGTIFAWFNFARELIGWLKEGGCTTGCSLNFANPFLSACFFGAIFFTAAFILGIIILKKYGK